MISLITHLFCFSLCVSAWSPGTGAPRLRPAHWASTVLRATGRSPTRISCPAVASWCCRSTIRHRRLSRSTSNRSGELTNSEFGEQHSLRRFSVCSLACLSSFSAVLSRYYTAGGVLATYPLTQAANLATVLTPTENLNAPNTFTCGPNWYDM